MDLSGIELSGLQPVTGLLVIITVMIAGVALTILTYWHYQHLSKRVISILILSRWIVFLILITLLLNPVLNIATKLDSRQKVAVLVDNSASIDITKGSWTGQDAMIQVLNRLPADRQEYDLDLFSMDSDANLISTLQELTFDAAVTNLYESLRTVLTSANYGQIVLITDGISTQGREVVYAVMEDRTPVHVIAVGDTTRVNDIVLQDIDYPRETSINTSYTINTTIRNDGFPGQSIPVVLRKNGVIVESTSINTTHPRSIHQVQFEISNTDEGIFNYTVEIEPIQGEWTTENNSRSFIIQAVDNKTRILYLSFELHPDVGATKTILDRNPSFDLEEYVWLRGNSFIQNPLPGPSEQFDLVIVHGLPLSVDAALAERLYEYITSLNSIFIITPSVNFDAYRSIFRSHMHLGSFDRTPSRFTYQLNPNNQHVHHPILELPSYDWTRSPLVHSYLSNVLTRQGVSSIIVANQRGEMSTIPLISTHSLANRRSVHIYFTGISQWLLNGTEMDRQMITELFENLVTWSSSPVDSGAFTLRTNQQEYSTNDGVLFNAQVINESGVADSDAQIDITVVSASIEDSILYTMQSTGIGLYTTTIPPLPAGEYTYSGIARKGDSVLGTQSGQFSVGNVQMELVNTVRNDDVLQTVAELAGGNFVVYDAFTSFDDLLSEMDPVITTSSRTRYIIAHSPIPYLLILILISAEWFLRRKYLLP